VSIIINIPHPAYIEQSIWPQSSYFGLFSGHSGKSCSDYLKSTLSSLIFSSPDFPRNTKKALFTSFIQADADFLKQAKEQGNVSGSCALVLLLIGDKCFVANTGDTRAIISIGQGKAVTTLSADHRPAETSEFNRIIEAGGKIYTDQMVNERGENVNYGPLLVEPGKLRFSRSFGDIDAKDQDFGGNDKVLIPDPHIKSFPIRPEQDFIFIATWSVFERLGNREICEIVFKNARLLREKGLAAVLASAVEEVLSEAVDRGCSENATAVVVAFKGLKNVVKGSEG
jgi:protein phosphatase 2C family protein 2/3